MHGLANFKNELFKLCQWSMSWEITCKNTNTSGNEWASNSTYLAFVCFCIIKLHIILYPASYIIGSVLSCLHANKQNRTELKCHLLQGTATTEDKGVSVIKQLHMYPPPVAPAKTNASWCNDLHVYGLMFGKTYCQWICDEYTVPAWRVTLNCTAMQASVTVQVLGHLHN
jgi:hypothetical protein